MIERFSVIEVHNHRNGAERAEKIATVEAHSVGRAVDQYAREHGLIESDDIYLGWSTIRVNGRTLIFELDLSH